MGSIQISSAGGGQVPLRGVAYAEMDLLARSACTDPRRAPLFLMLGFDAEPFAAQLAQLRFLRTHRSSSEHLRLSGLRYRRPGALADTELHLDETVELSRVDDLSAGQLGPVYVVARSLADEAGLDWPAMERVAARCVLAGEWRAMHLVEWRAVRQGVPRGLQPQTRRTLPAGYWWRLLGPVVRDVRQGALWLDWALLTQGRAHGVARPVARVTTHSDGTPLRVETAREIAALRLFERAGATKVMHDHRACQGHILKLA